MNKLERDFNRMLFSKPKTVSTSSIQYGFRAGTDETPLHEGKWFGPYNTVEEAKRHQSEYDKENVNTDNYAWCIERWEPATLTNKGY